MSRSAIVALLLLAASMPAVRQETLAHPNVNLQGALYRAVFTTSTETLSPPDVAGLPEDLRVRLNRFLIRRGALEGQAAGSVISGPGSGIADGRRILERAIVALVEREDARALAADFLSGAPVAEWGESAQAPLNEARHAERRLTPDAPLAPFLYVFIAQRQRAAFELADRAQDLDTMKAAAKKYRAVMQRARSVPDSIYGLLADDLDRMPFVHAKSDKHPATFNPDT